MIIISQLSYLPFSKFDETLASAFVAFLCDKLIIQQQIHNYQTYFNIKTAALNINRRLRFPHLPINLAISKLSQHTPVPRRFRLWNPDPDLLDKTRQRFFRNASYACGLNRQCLCLFASLKRIFLNGCHRKGNPFLFYFLRNDKGLAFFRFYTCDGNFSLFPFEFRNPVLYVPRHKRIAFFKPLFNAIIRNADFIRI